MLSREEDVQVNANLRKVVQRESLGRGLYKSPPVVVSGMHCATP